MNDTEAHNLILSRIDDIKEDTAYLRRRVDEQDDVCNSLDVRITDLEGTRRAGKWFIGTFVSLGGLVAAVLALLP